MTCNMKHVIGLVGPVLLTLAACGGEAPSSDALDSEAFELRRGERYALDPSDTWTKIFPSNFNYPDAHDVERCDQFDNGVVRSWYLKEKNRADFRWSKHFCRNMGPYGRLQDEYDAVWHNYNDGDGTKGSSSIPLSRLPVGIKFKYKTLGGVDFTDVAMVYNKASNIIDGATSHPTADWALGRSGDEGSLVCPAGKVLVGMAHNFEYSNVFNQFEIEGVRIRCDALVVESD